MRASNPDLSMFVHEETASLDGQKFGILQTNTTTGEE